MISQNLNVINIQYMLPFIISSVVLCAAVEQFSLCFFQIGSHIKKQVGELGFSCTGLVTKAGALQCNPNDSFTKKDLIESARKVSEKVSFACTCSLVKVK